MTSLSCLKKRNLLKMFTMKWVHPFHPTVAHSHTAAPLFSPLSQPCLQRNRRNYRVLRLWLLQARPWGSNISTSIPFPSSFLAAQAPFILLYRSCWDYSQGLRLGGKLYQLNDQQFSTSYISHGIKGNPPLCKWGWHTSAHTRGLAEWTKRYQTQWWSICHLTGWVKWELTGRNTPTHYLNNCMSVCVCFLMCTLMSLLRGC